MKKLQPEPVGDARLRRRFVLIGLIGALPLFFVALLLINVAYSTPIEFGVQEQRGIVFQRLIEGVLEALPRYAAPSRRRRRAVERPFCRATPGGSGPAEAECGL